MDKPLISIITPVYNAEQYLDECIGSVLNQTYTNIELILINDGSTDGSPGICRKWADQDERVKLIDKKNEGAAIARNIGINNAKGSLIGFVDNDDIIEPDMYEIMYRDMKKADADIVMCNSRSYKDGKRGKNSLERYSSFEIERRALVERFLSYEKIFASSVWSKLYKKEIIGEVRFLENIMLGDDYFFNGIIYPKIRKMYYEERMLYNYRIREGSMCRSDIGEHFFDKYRVAEKLSENLKKYEFIDDSYLNKFTLSTLYEILYELCIKKADKKLIKTWKNKFNRKFKSDCKFKTTNKKNYIKMFMLGHFPRFYVNVTGK